MFCAFDDFSLKGIAAIAFFYTPEFGDEKSHGCGNVLIWILHISDGCADMSIRALDIGKGGCDMSIQAPDIDGGLLRYLKKLCN